MSAGDSVIGADCTIWTLNLKGVIVDVDGAGLNYTVLADVDEWFIPMWMVVV